MRLKPWTPAHRSLATSQFLALRFVAFVALVLFKRLPIHPLHYLLAGLALAILFLLLLSLSGHIAFWQAYLLSAAACIGVQFFFRPAPSACTRAAPMRTDCILFGGTCGTIRANRPTTGLAMRSGANAVIHRTGDARGAGVGGVATRRNRPQLERLDARAVAVTTGDYIAVSHFIRSTAAGPTNEGRSRQISDRQTCRFRRAPIRRGR
ncbi:cell envelope integrity protein CreD [Xanthomonas fragariae]|nr:cell envelope integrity protein CreD [Xanthomonas fragariae]